MNDYKELIVGLRENSCCYAYDDDCSFCGVKEKRECRKARVLIKNAADAIEQLVNEQKETAYLLKQYIPFTDNPCAFCTHKNAKHDTKEFIENCDVCLEAQHYCCWEYGGLSDAMKASMELNEILKAKLREWRELK